MRFLGLDIGSSSIKGAVLDEHGACSGTLVREPFPGPVAGLPPGHFEIDPAEAMSAVHRILAQLSSAAPDAQGILFCSQMGGVILVGADGCPRSNYLSWRDERALEVHPHGGTYLSEIQRCWDGSEMAEVTELKPGSATALLFWLRENSRLPPQVIPASLGDFVVSQLCATLPRMERTQAVGLLDLARDDWHTGALVKLGLGDLKWLPLADGRVPAGETMLGHRRLPCYPALGDQQCALLGAALAEGELSLNISTGSQVSQITPQLRLGPYQTRPYFGGRYLNTITHLPAGRSLNVLMDLLTELARAEETALADPWSHVAREVAVSDGGGLDCRLSFFDGPMGDRGRIDGIRLENLTVGNLFHAALRNMAENYRICAERLCPDRSWTRVVVSGGLSQSLPVLRQLIQREFPASPVRELAAGEDTLRGLAAAARAIVQS